MNGERELVPVRCPASKHLLGRRSLVIIGTFETKCICGRIVIIEDGQPLIENQPQEARTPLRSEPDPNREDSAYASTKCFSSPH